MSEVGFIPKKIVERGEEIYRTRFKSDFEANFLGQFVMIDVNTEQAYRGATAEEALQNARRQSAEGPFHLIKVGEAGAFKVRYPSDGNNNWVFR